MKRLIALTLALAACSDEPEPTVPEPAALEAGPVIPGQTTFWFESTDPDGRRYWCLWVGWIYDEGDGTNGAHSIDCELTLEIP